MTTSTPLSFTQEGNTYVATARVTSRFSLRLVRKEHGTVLLYVRSTDDGPYTLYSNPAFKASAPLVCEGEFSFEAISKQSPRYIRIVSFADISEGYITESGIAEGVLSSDIEHLSEQIDSIKGINNTTEEIDSTKETYDFLDGYKNSDTLKNVIDQETAVAAEGSVESLFQS